MSATLTSAISQSRLRLARPQIHKETRLKSLPDYIGYEIDDYCPVLLSNVHNRI